MLVVGINILAWNLNLGMRGLGFWVDLNAGRGN